MDFDMELVKRDVKGVPPDGGRPSASNPLEVFLLKTAGAILGGMRSHSLESLKFGAAPPVAGMLDRFKTASPDDRTIEARSVSAARRHAPKTCLKRGL